jgi:hypothetical protein
LLAKSWNAFTSVDASENARTIFGMVLRVVRC